MVSEAVDDIQERFGVRVLVSAVDGPVIESDSDCLSLIGDAMGADASVVALPVSRLSADFWKLRTGVAGGILQKFVNYRLVLAIVGDVSAHIGASDALRDFVYEANRGRHTWFVSTLDDLDPLLARIS